MTTIVQAITQAVYSLFRGWQPKEGQAQSPWWIAMLAVLILGGCAGNPLKAAETAEQKAFAAYGQFVVLEELAAAVIGEPAVPDPVKLQIQRLDARLKPMADSMRETALLAQDVRDQVEAGETTEERLQIVTAQLNAWLQRFLPLLDEFKSVVRG